MARRGGRCKSTLPKRLSDRNLKTAEEIVDIATSTALVAILRICILFHSGGDQSGP